ncbi:YALIA101S01e05050g1_1 [Yarrowia lipolytica]|nr:Hypothetical protein YALI2_C00510g [Yarrowia lipolytica]SEI30679.1 YALIA101S01e05050g1_1 [Yarrowia lipolytica]
MKFTTLVLLTAVLQQAKAQNVIADGAIDGFSNGVISAHNSEINDAQAKSEVDQLVKYIASNPFIYDILDQAGNSVLVGFDTDSFPAFVTAVINSANSYEESPDFTTARSLISQYLPHYNVQQAINNVQSENTLYWNLFTANVKSFTTDAGVASAVSSGSARVSKLFSDLGIFATPTGDTSATPTSAVPTTSASPPSSSAAPSSSAVPSSSAAPSSSATPTSSEAPSSSEAVSSTPPSSEGVSSTAVSSTAVSSTAVSSETPSSSTSQGNLSSTGASSSQAQFTSETPISTETGSSAVSSGSSAVSSGSSAVSSGSDVSSEASATPTSSGAFVTVTSVESITSTVVQTITHCSDNKCVTPTISLTTVVPTNPGITTIKTVVEGVTLTITVPCDTTTAGPEPQPTTEVVTYLPTTIVVGSQSLVVTPEPETVTYFPTTQGNSNPQPTNGGNQGNQVTTVVGPQPTNTDSTTYITQVITQTLTHCDGWFNWNCVTPTVTLTTVVPTDHATAAVQAVVSGNTYTLTVPYDTNTAPRAPQPTANSGSTPNVPAGNGGNAGIGGQQNGGQSTPANPTPGSQSENPKNGIQQANGASAVGVSIAAAVAGAFVFLL